MIAVYYNIMANKQIRAFSLAELMIAIGILGVGLMLVAVTFPVGLDQTRIVAEQSIAPLLANEAFTTLQMLLNDPNNTPRIAPDSDVANPVRTFRQALLETIPPPVPTLLIDNLLIGRNINNWLGSPCDIITKHYDELSAQWIVTITKPYSPNPKLGNISDTSGGNTRYYPSNSGGWVEPSYTWSTLFRRHDADNVQFIVFVNRRSYQTPRFVSFGVGSYTVNSSKIDLSSGTILLANFSENSFLVRQDGLIFRIKSINNTPGKESLVLDHVLIEDPDDDIPPIDPRYSLPPGSDPIFWFVPTNLNTGRSPCVNVYSRTLSLQ